MFAQCLQVKRTICDCSRLIYFSSLYFVLSISTQLLLRIGPISWPNMDIFWTDFFSPIGGKVSNSYHNCDRAGLCCVFGEESFQTLPLQLWPSLIYDFFISKVTCLYLNAHSEHWCTFWTSRGVACFWQSCYFKETFYTLLMFWVIFYFRLLF